MVLAAVALLLVLACRGYDWDALGRYKGDNISSLHYVRGRVVEVLRDDTKPDQLDPARSMGTQELRILLLEGANKGTEVTIANYLTRTQNVRLRQGETAIICEDLPDSADAYYTVYNYDRAPVLVLILAVFAAAVVAIGGWKGVRTLLGLGFTGAMIAWLILPGIYHGLPSLPLTVAALAVCTLVSLLLLNPPSPKTWAAMLSTLAGVALAGGVFYLFSTLLHLSGMNDTNGEGLVLVAGQTGLELAAAGSGADLLPGRCDGCGAFAGILPARAAGSRWENERSAAVCRGHAHWPRYDRHNEQHINLSFCR